MTPKRAGPPSPGDYSRLIRAERVLCDALKKIADDEGLGIECSHAEIAVEALRNAYPPMVKP